MKPTVCVMVLLAVFCAQVYGKVYENQDFIDRPESQQWFVYVDFTLDKIQDLNISSLSVEDSTFAPDPDAPFQFDNDNDIAMKSNNFTLGVSHSFIDRDEYGMMNWYVGFGSSNSSIEIFPSGTIGVKGWLLEGGIQGDIYRFGSLLDKGIEIDCSISAMIAEGDKSGALSEDYDLLNGTLRAAAYYKTKTELMDTSDTYVYAGAELMYSQSWLTLELDSAAGSGTGEYTMSSQGLNSLLLVLGSRFYWESNRSTMDLRLSGALDGSYSVGVRLSQTF